MEVGELKVEQKELSYLIYGGQVEYEKFVDAKSLKDKFQTLKFRPETYAYESDQHLLEEGKVLLQLIELHKSSKINLHQYLPYLQDLTPYSRSIEVHLGLFKNLVNAFSSPGHSSSLQKSIDGMNIVGSVLYQEFDYSHNTVDNNIETIATFDPATKGFILNTPPHKAKLCKFFTPHSTHVIVFARIGLAQEKKLSSPYPFLIPLRNTKSLELSQGITMKWLGPSFGGISAREYAIELKDVVLETKDLSLGKYLKYSESKAELLEKDAVLEFIINLNFMLEQKKNIEKSIRDALKAAFLTIRHAKNRTQFQTLDEKGKERPIFEYEYNKTRIMKGFLEMFNLQSTCYGLGKRVELVLINPQKNAKLLNDIFVFYDMLEAYVNERCLVVIESFRESLGGIGFLKYSGIPMLQENALKNAAYTGPLKELRYLKFAQFLSNINFENPGDFIVFFASWLIKGPEFNTFLTKNFNQRSSFYAYYFSKKIFYYIEQVRENYQLKATPDCRQTLTKIANFEEITKLCESFVYYLKSFIVVSKMSLNLNRVNTRPILFSIVADSASKILEDAPFYLSQEGKHWPQDSFNVIALDFKNYIQALGEKSLEIVGALGFDENLLHSCISKTADETYEKMLDMSKHHNPRNCPKIQEEIRKDLLEFLNRPVKPKL